MSETTAEEPVRGNLTFPEMLRAAMSAMPAHSTLRQMLLETRGHIEKLEADLEAAEERAQKAEARRYNAEREVSELRAEQVRLKAELEEADSAQAKAEAQVKELEAGVAREEKEGLEALAERDHWEERIDAIADALGDQSEWSSENDRSESAELLAKDLRQRLEDLQKDQRAYAVRVLEKRRHAIANELRAVDYETTPMDNLEGPVRWKLAAHNELKALADRIKAGEA